MSKSNKITPGTYVVVGKLRCWTSFTLHSDGRVNFVDARDGHFSYNVADAAWIADMEKRLARGELARTGA